MSRKKHKGHLTIDVGPLFESQWTGIPVFTRRLIRAMQTRNDVELDFAYNFAKVQKSAVHAALASGTGTLLRDEFLSRIGTEGAGLVDPSRPILFPTVKPFGGGLLAREASTVHDLSTLFMPEVHEQANIAFHLDHFAKETETDEAIFCISDATKSALVTAFPSAASKTRLIYQYADWPSAFELMDANLPPLQLGRYAVVIGTIEPRKNLGILFKALNLSEIAGLKLNFIVIGKKGWLVDDLLRNLTEKQRSMIQFSGFVSEFIKYRLIKNSEFLVFPSLYEGFGIPALEAMSLSKPVLASRSSSLPEVVGDGGLYFDPASPTDFTSALLEISDPGKQRELAPRALEQSRAFHPARMAEPVADWVLG